MFIPSHWAMAFINSIEEAGGKAEEGIELLKVFSSWASSLPGEIFGAADAERAEKLLREGIRKSSLSEDNEIKPGALEAAIRFFVMTLKKKTFRHIDSIINEAKRILNKKNGIIAVTLEYAFPPEDESQIKEAIKKHTRASRVDMTGRLNTDLIGGYRLQIGDEIIDTSVHSQLRKLESCLVGNGGDLW